MSDKKDNSLLYIFGGISGALIGILAAFLLEKSSEAAGEENVLTGKNLSRIGLGAIAFLYPFIGKGKGKGWKRFL